MKRRHFDALRPVCPLCQSRTLEHSPPLRIGWVVREEDGRVDEGALQCTNPECLSEYPIIDGIPILVPDPRVYISENILQLVSRQDLSEEIEALLGECCGPGSNVDVGRLHLNNYAWDHYGEFDPLESTEDPRPGSIARALDQGLESVGEPLAGPVVDVGCSVGRSTFELAQRCDDLVLGVDLNFSMLKLAAGVERHGVVRYPRRKVGLVYQRREFPVRLI